MLIEFSCQCGKKLKTDESHVGKEVKCPLCHRMLTIPGLLPGDTHENLPPVEPLEEALAGSTPTVCPECGKSLPFDTEVCPCGYSFVLGQVLAQDTVQARPRRRKASPLLGLSHWQWTIMGGLATLFVVALGLAWFLGGFRSGPARATAGTVDADVPVATAPTPAPAATFVPQPSVAARPDPVVDNMKEILSLLLAYRDSHHQSLPADLEQFRTAVPAVEPLLAHPKTGENPGVMYLAPDELTLQNEADGAIVVLYEVRHGLPVPHGYIGYLDGTVDKQ